MSREYLLCSPVTIERPRSRNLPLNLNEYRNAHFQTLNGMKKKYKEIMRQQIECLPEFEKIQIDYKLFPKTKRLCDINNIISIIDKFFCDALVELGRLEEDNYLHVPKTSSEFGEVDKDNPRVEITIKEI